MEILSPFWIAVCILLLVMALMSSAPAIKTGWEKLISPVVLNVLTNTAKKPKTNFSMLKSNPSMLLIGAAITALALSTPVIRKKNDDALQHATAWIAVADVSKSMTVNDIAPSRLTAMRDALSALTVQAGARPLALIIFAGDAFLAVPPVFDKTLLKQHIALLDYGVIPQDGSNLTRALSLTNSVLEDSGLVRARIFVLSDGAGMNNSSITAVRHLADAGHQIDVMLFGTDSTNNATATDIKQASRFASAGAGELVAANSLGSINIATLDLEADTSATNNSAIRALYWSNQSHWLLLLLLPVALTWFRLER